MVSSPTSPAFSSSYASSFRPSHQHIAIPTIVITPSCDASEKLDSYPFPLDTLEYASPPSVPLSGSSEKGGSATIVTGGGGGGGGRYGEKGRSGSRVHRAFVVVFGLLMMALLMGSWLDGSGGVSLASLGLTKGRSAVGGVVEEEVRSFPSFRTKEDEPALI
jgi:hypothetical protein